MKVLCFLIAFLPLCPRVFAQAQPVDGYVAIVNDRMITAGDVMEYIAPVREQLRRSQGGRELAESQVRLYREGLEKLIENALILSAFDALKGTLPSTAVGERMDMIVRERFNGDRTALLRTLQAAGKSEAEWQGEIRDQVIVQTMTQEFVTRKIRISPREIRELYEEKQAEFASPLELRLRIIAFRPPAETNRFERLRDMYRIQIEVAGGADFADAARRVSQGQFAEEGGDHGWMRLDGLRPELREAIQDMRPGEISDLIMTPVQYYIVKVEDRRGGEMPALAQVQSKLESELRGRAYDRLYQAWIEGLKNQFPIQRFSVREPGN